MDEWLDKDVRWLKGVGEKRAALLQSLGIVTVFDLLKHYPRTYEDRTRTFDIARAPAGEPCCVVAELVTPVRQIRLRRGLVLFRFKAADQTGSVEVTLYNRAHLAAGLSQGCRYLFYGRLDGKGKRRSMSAPKIEPVTEGTEPGGIVPVYPLCAGLTQTIMKKVMSAALALCENGISDPLPPALRKRHRLCGLHFALANIHRPSSFEALESARRRLVFEELFIFSLALSRLKRRNRGRTGAPMRRDVSMEPFFGALPFAFTGAQRRAFDEIIGDMRGETPMSRLLQGDVGCGKTVVAAGAAYFAVKNGWQAAFMAPTEILAAQHYDALAPLLSRLGITCALLTGRLSERDKSALWQRVAAGDVDVCIGTHALVQDGLEFSRLGLAVTDEQHRFGVGQRAALCGKGDNPHVLVMSATPIPRTLALILYGDLDISVIDELPPGRQRVETYLVEEDMRERVYAFIEKELAAGRQAYIVCPLIEEGEGSMDGVKSARESARELAGRFRAYRPALLHGQMTPELKEAAMRAFYEGRSRLLVSTTVVEVGVNVQNATVMMIENAERFGLSQLHQLRGRVGRGAHKSYCFLMSGTRSPRSRERLSVLCETDDGFKISERDLALRGPGDFFGFRQSGRLDRRLTALMTDVGVFAEAAGAAAELLKADPELCAPEHRLLKAAADALTGPDPQRHAVFN